MVRMSYEMRAARAQQRAMDRAKEKIKHELRNELDDSNRVPLRGANLDVLDCLVPCLAKFELPARLGNPWVKKPDHGAGSDEALDLILSHLDTYPAVTDILSREITRQDTTRMSIGNSMVLVMYGSLTVVAKRLGIPTHILAYVRLAQISTTILDYDQLVPWREELWKELSWLRTLTRMVKSMTPGGAEYTTHQWLRPGCITPAMVLAANFPSWALRNDIEPRIPLAKVRLPLDLRKYLEEALAVAALVSKKNDTYAINIGS